MATTTTPIQNAENLKAALAGDEGELDAWLEVNDEAELKEAIRVLLKMQDRDTRHACAEAVIALNGNGHIVPTAAHAACMNARAV